MIVRCWNTERERERIKYRERERERENEIALVTTIVQQTQGLFLFPPFSLSHSSLCRHSLSHNFLSLSVPTPFLSLLLSHFFLLLSHFFLMWCVSRQFYHTPVTSCFKHDFQWLVCVSEWESMEEGRKKERTEWEKSWRQRWRMHGKKWKVLSSFKGAERRGFWQQKIAGSIERGRERERKKGEIERKKAEREKREREGIEMDGKLELFGIHHPFTMCIKSEWEEKD